MPDMEQFLRESSKFQGKVEKSIEVIETDITGMREDHRERAKSTYDKIEKLADLLHEEREERIQKDGLICGDVKVVKDRQNMAHKKSMLLGGSGAGIIVALKYIIDWLRGS